MSRKLLLRILLAALASLVVLFFLANVNFNPLPEGAQADRVLVEKSKRKLSLIRNGATIKTYSISLGSSPQGHKSQEGDDKTSEGSYTIDSRNPDSVCHLALHISYPNRADRERGRREGVSAGGDIMIHGIRNGAGWIGALHRLKDWTEGCIAMTNPEMEELFRAVPRGTPIEIVR
jgi:murein L,D-transpeptidase YafK